MLEEHTVVCTDLSNVELNRRQDKDVKDDRVLLVLRTSDRSGVSGFTMEELKNLAIVDTHVQ